MNIWFYNEGKLTVRQRLSPASLYSLSTWLHENVGSVSSVNVQPSREFATLYVLKKHLQRNVLLEMSDEDKMIWNSLNTDLPTAQDLKGEQDHIKPFQAIKMLTLRANDSYQNKFWIRVFLRTLKILTIDNIVLLAMLLFGVGIAIAFITYREFLAYGIELESCKIVVYAGVKILCPMMTNFVLTAKSGTGLSAAIQSMHTEFKMMNLLNLPYHRVYLHPIFIAFVIAGPIMNLLAIGAILSGGCTSWAIKNHPIQLFFSLLNADFKWSYIIESECRALLCSLCGGFAVCLSGMIGGESFDSVLKSVNLCVVISFTLNILIQALVSIWY